MTGTKTPIAAEIRARLAPLGATRLDIIDESAQHAGHSVQARAGESHFRLRLSAPGFAAMSRLARHRAVHQALGPDLLARIHALALELD